MSTYVYICLLVYICIKLSVSLHVCMHTDVCMYVCAYLYCMCVQMYPYYIHTTSVSACERSVRVHMC